MARRLSTERSLTPHVPRVALRWEAEGGGLWREIDGSLVFVDISGFTALSEKLARKGRVGAEELTGTLSACFGELLAVAYEAGGSLLKFGGDALLLLFDGQGHASRACASALLMRETMARVGRVTTSAGNVRLRMSVGVHSGALHLFRIGASHHELIVTGPGASTTVEMEGTADAGEIVVSPATAALIDPRLVGAAKGSGFLLRRRAVAVEEGYEAGPVPPAIDAARCVPVALREQLLSGDAESEHRHVSIAFVHFDGVDDLLEREGASVVAAELDHLVRDAQGAAEHHGVTFLATDIDRDGGKVILIAGAPRAMGDDEGRMLGCLRQIADGDRQLPVRIGVNHGHVFVGQVGPSFRRTYTVMGDAVNLAARLMANATPGQILATSTVLDRSATEYGTVALEPFMVKGKSQPVIAFAVGAQGAHRHDEASGRLPFIGRDEELRELRDVLHRAAAGAGGLHDLSGDAGIGKSRLVEELVAGAEGFTVVRAFCEPYESSTPYYAFGFLLRGVAGVKGRGRAGGGELERTVARVAPDLLPWLPLVGAAAGVEVAPTAEVDALEPRFRRARTRWAVVQLLEALVAKPTVLVVDEAEWIDGPSVELLTGVAEAAATRPWLVLVLRRADANGAGEAELRAAASTAMRLEPLDDAAAGALVSAATAGAPLLPHERDALVSRAGGNPLFLDELLRARAGAGDDPLPDSLESVVAAQIDRLAPADRRLLRYASVLGSTFDASLLGAVTDGALRTAAAATRRFPGFLERAGSGLVRFRNECHRQVAYDALPFGRRRQLHAQVGEALERAAGDDTDDRATTLSFHFLHAQQWERCWRYARAGAEQARVKYANVEASALYERALTAAAHLDVPGPVVAEVCELLGDVALLAGAFDRTRAAYRRARRLRAGDAAALAHLCAREYRVAMHQGRADVAVRWVRRGLRLLERSTDATALWWRADLRYMLAHSHQQSGRPRRALAEAQRALADAAQSGNRPAEPPALLLMDWALVALGRAAEATHAPRALAIAEELGTASRIGEALVYMGNFAYMRGQWNDALELWTRAGDAYLRAGNTVDATFGTSNSAEILLCQGHYDEAEKRLRGVLEVWQSMGYSGGVGDVLTSLGRIALNRGDVADATLLFTQAAELFASMHDGRELAALGALAECRLHEGDVDTALAGLADALRRQTLTGDTTFAPMLHRVRAYAFAAVDRLDDAWASVDESLAVARAAGAVYEVALSLEAVAVIAELGGLPHDETADAERAALLEQLGIQSTPPPPVRVAA